VSAFVLVVVRVVNDSARWLNHACAPNCDTVEDEGRIFIHTLRSIGAGEELFMNICSPLTICWMKTSGRSTHAGAPRPAVVPRC
jgi:hypothetical protein